MKISKIQNITQAIFWITQYGILNFIYFKTFYRKCFIFKTFCGNFKLSEDKQDANILLNADKN